MQIKSIDPVSLKKRLDEGSAVLIDIREAHEHAREHIEGARLAPLSRFHGEDFSEHREKTAVFYCHSGGRAAFVGQRNTRKQSYYLGFAARFDCHAESLQSISIDGALSMQQP